MEVCGGQTHSIVRYGIDRLLPDAIELVHGPGCPVCVTALETIDRAHAIAQQPEVIFTSFGDMLRVPGSHGDLLGLKARGADVRVVYSPLDALGAGPRQPASASRLLRHRIRDHRARQRDGWSTRRRGSACGTSRCWSSHVLVPPSIAYVLQAPDNRVQAFLGPGHVCAVVGSRPYEDWRNATAHPSSSPGSSRSICSKACCAAVRQLEAGAREVENQYARTVDATTATRRRGG